MSTSDVLNMFRKKELEYRNAAESSYLCISQHKKLKLV